MEKLNRQSPGNMHERQASREAYTPNSLCSSKSMNFEGNSTETHLDFAPYFNHHSSNVGKKLHNIFNEQQFNAALLAFNPDDLADTEVQHSALASAKRAAAKAAHFVKKDEARFLGESASKIPDFPDQDLKNMIDWNSEGHSGELRYAALNAMLEVDRIKDKAYLFLEDYRLSTLPPLPTHVNAYVMNLSLKGNRLTWPAIKDLDKMSQLMQLHLDRNKLEFYASSSPRFEQLTLNANQLKDVTLDCENLHQLSLRDNPDLRSLENVHCPKLRQLDLKHTGVTSSIQDLKTQFPALQTLIPPSGKIHCFK
jgi:hypothetical protein